MALHRVEKNIGEEGLAPFLFIDLETSGLSRQKNQIFLFGLLEGEGSDQGQLIQFYIEKEEEEGDLLRAVLPLLHSRKLVSFHGQSFALPFLKERARACGLPLPQLDPFDIAAALRQRRAFLDLSSFTMEALEKKLSLQRRDRLSGQAVASALPLMGQAEVRDKVLLHNEEDLRHTALIYQALQAFRRSLSFTTITAGEKTTFELQSAQIEKDFLSSSWLSSRPAPLKLVWSSSFGDLVWEGERMRMTCPIHRLRGDSQHPLLYAAVSPSFQADSSSYALRPPFLLIYDGKKFKKENLISLARDLLAEAEN